MPKHSFLDTILKRPSQSYAEPQPSSSKSGSGGRAGWNAPTDLPNASGRPQSILAGSMYNGGGGKGASNAPSISGMSTTSRFGRFRKRRPSVSNGSIFNDGASSVAPYAESNVSASPRKSRWWEAGSLRLGKSGSRAPSVAGSVFSEPEAPPAMPSFASVGKAAGAPRASRSDYGEPPSRHRLHSNRSVPPLPALPSGVSVSAMRSPSGVAPLGQQQPSLVRQGSRSSLGRSTMPPPAAHPSRPTSPTGSVGRPQRTRSTHGGSQDWKSFVDSMAGTEVAKTWESMPQLAPTSPAAKSKARLEQRKSVVTRVQKELNQDAQFEQLQRDAGVVRQDLLARAASQVIGEAPPLPPSLPANLQPGELVDPVASARLSSEYVAPPRSPVVSAAAAVPQVGYIPTAPQPLAVPAVRAVPAPIEEYTAPPHQPRSMAAPEPAQYVATAPRPVLTQDPSIAAAEQIDTESEESDPETEESSSSEDEMLPNQTLDVVAEEDEETSSNGHGRHQEMKNIPTIRGKSTAKRYSEYDAVLRHHRSGSNITQELEQASTATTPGIAISRVRSPALADEDESVASESQAESPLFKQPGPEPELTLSSLPPAAGMQADDTDAHLTKKAGPALQTAHDDATVPPTPPAKSPSSAAPPVLTDSTPVAAAAAVAAAPVAMSTVETDSLGLIQQRPPLVARQSSASDYRSARSGRSTPTAKGVTFDGSEDDDEQVVAAGETKQAVTVATETASGNPADDGKATDEAEDARSDSGSSAAPSISSRRPVSVRSSRSSRRSVLQRRLSDVSLGTSFALSGIVGGHSRPSSRRVRLADDDSDSPVDLSDDDADLKARAMAEQDRLRTMKVGDDFFGPSLTGLIDRFDRMNWSDTTLNRIGREGSAGSIQKGDAASIRSKRISQAQDAINEIRQRRADAGPDEDGKTRASSAGGLAPSFAAIWLLNQANDGDAEDALAKLEAKPAATSSATFTSIPAYPGFSPSKNGGDLFASTKPEEPKISIMDRPRQRRPAKPDEMGGLKISDGKLEPETPLAAPEDTRSTLPASLSDPSSVRSGSGAKASAAVESSKQPVAVLGGVASKDKPPPAKSAMKNLKPSKSLADTLFSIPRLSSEAKAERKREKEEKRARRASISSEKSAKAKSKRESKDKSRKSMDSLPRSSIASERSQDSAALTPSSTSTELPASVSEPAVLSEKAAGKRPQRDSDEDATAARADVERREVVAAATAEDAQLATSTSGVPVSDSIAFAQFQTPDQSMADISAATTASPPQKFHTAKDLAALARAESPEPELPARSEASKRLSTQMKAMDGFSSFSLSSFSVQPEEFKKDPEAEAATETGEDIAGTAGAVEADEMVPAPVADVEAADASRAVEVESEDTARRPSRTDSESSIASEGHFDSATLTVASDVSAPSTAQTTPVGSEVTSSRPEDLADLSGKRLPMPPRPTPADVATLANDDKTPTGNPPRVGINLIPPTPPATENRLSFVGAQAPTTPTIQEEDPMSAHKPQRPALISRSSSHKEKSRQLSDAGKAGSEHADSLARSKTVSAKKKPQWQEYHGKGISLPPGLIATKVASSSDRKIAQSLPPLDVPLVARSDSTKKLGKKRAPALQTMPAASATRDQLPAIPEPEAVVPLAPASPVSPSSPRSPTKRQARGPIVPGSIVSSSSLTRIIAEAPPVPRIPEAFSSPSPVSSSASRFEAVSEPMSRAASSSGNSEAGSISPAPSHVPSQSARSNASWVSSSVHSASMRGSPRPEYSYVNEALSPYARKMRALSPGPSSPVPGAHEARRNSLMGAVNEWESHTPEEFDPHSLSPLPSVAHSIASSSSRYPPLPASTISRPSSVISATSSPAIVRSAPLGASTATYLQPPVARSRLAAADESTVAALRDSTVSPVFDNANGSVASFNSSPSASQSVASLPSTMQTVPTSYRPNKDAGKFSGTAEELLNTRTTMQTIAVSSGAFPNRSKSVVRRKQSSEQEKRTSLDVPEHLQDELNLTTLSLTAHTPPPRKVTSGQVLVQVIAVAIDEMDRLLLRERVRSENAFGFVPGRSFCGRVVECGYEVKKMRKGDIVFGLQDSRKSGALAEFMTIDADLVAHAPRDCLTTEQIAALPSAGVTAFQILHNHCANLPRGARVLILNAHDAIGLLTMQEAVGLGLIIVAQCPPSVSDGVAVCQANGAHEVVIGEPLWAINSLHESSFDLVVDTVGGRRIYDAARRILAFEGQFTTCFGDEHSTANPNLKSHLRSLRRAFFKKDKKNIGYEWVGADTGDDCREALEAVRLAAEKGEVCPRLRSVLPFADAPRAFDPTSRNLDDEPGAIVVRVS